MFVRTIQECRPPGFDTPTAPCYDKAMSGKHVLLVAPYIHDFAAYDLWLKPLGLLYVAAAAEAAGYSVRILNCLDRRHPAVTSSPGPSRARNHPHGTGKFSWEPIPKPPPLAMIPRRYKRYGIPLEAFRNGLADGPPPDAIGVSSMMTYWCDGVGETISLAREAWPGVPVILGGVYASLCPDHAREHAGADYLVTGPGEEGFVEILRSIIGKGAGPRADSDRLAGSSSPREARFGMTSVPAYHLLDNLDSVSMLTSFGCPFACAYCASKLLRNGFIQRPVKDVVEEIEYYVNDRKIRDIALYDDALLVKPDDHIKPILREVIAEGLQACFHAPNGLHANMIDEELAHLMKETGFATVRLSIESIDAARLKDSCAKVTPDGFKRAVSCLLAAGFEIGDLQAYLLMGVPGQQESEVKETMLFAHEMNTLVRLSDFSPIPGTGYFRAATETYGLDLSEPLLQNSSVYPYLVPGLADRYKRLKELARSLNTELLRHTENVL
ncbi:B12-binding domain-containing radical SAM protein [Candidatus Poribacteria bacterium]|nr:B12-binding domain-containing radical SAM protein [Candidatus Poribacteria bacterium]